MADSTIHAITVIANVAISDNTRKGCSPVRIHAMKNAERIVGHIGSALQCEINHAQLAL